MTGVPLTLGLLRRDLTLERGDPLVRHQEALSQPCELGGIDVPVAVVVR